MRPGQVLWIPRSWATLAVSSLVLFSVVQKLVPNQESELNTDTPLGTYQKCTFSGPSPDLLNQKLGVGPAMWVSLSPRGILVCPQIENRRAGTGGPSWFWPLA